MSYRPQPGPSFNNANPHEGIGRSSPLPPMPHVGGSNLGQPGSVQQSHPSQNLHPSSSQQSVNDKGPDYVYFERKPNQFGEAITGKAMAAKMKLELYYKEAVEGVVGRKER